MKEDASAPTLGRVTRTHGADAVLAAALSGLTLALALYFASRGFNGGFVDMAHDGYQLRQAFDLSHGARLFRDTFEQYGLLTPYFNQVGFLTLGRRLLAIKYFVALWYGATAVLMYALARQFLGRTLSACSVLLWIGLAPFYQHGIMLSPHAYVLLFQASAMILAIGDKEGEHRGRWWMIGALCGICWLFKQSLGTLFFAAFVMFLCSTATLERQAIRRLGTRLVDLTAGLAMVVVVSLVWLFARGALHDWYLQTIVFPKAFYLSYYRDTGTGGGVSALALARLFVQLQTTAAGYWLVLRAVVIGGGVFALIRRKPEDRKLLLAAWVMLLLWLAAFPSANYMHQWWTIGPTLCAAVYAVHLLASATLARMHLPARGLAAALTVAVIGAIAWPGLATRWNDGWGRAASPYETIVEPRSLSGIKTDPLVRRSISALYGAIANFRAHHPGAPVLSIDSHEGVSDNAESLLLLSFVEDNRHPGPIYWNLPVLSTVVYASYPDDFQRFVRQEQPLIVDYQNEGVAARVVPAYYLLSAAPTMDGYWFVYAPNRAAAAAHGEPPVAPPPVAAPKLDTTAPEKQEYLTVSLDGHQVQARVYASPGGMSVPSTLAASVPAGVETPVNPSTQVQQSERGLVIRGVAPTPDAYLLQMKERDAKQGDYFVATGVIEEGGVTVGLQREGQWAGFVNVTQPGPFVAVVVVPQSGRYTVMLANCVTLPTWSARVSRHGLFNAFSGWLQGTLPNSFQIDSAGWVDAPSR